MLCPSQLPPGVTPYQAVAARPAHLDDLRGVPHIETTLLALAVRILSGGQATSWQVHRGTQQILERLSRDLPVTIEAGQLPGVEVQARQ